MSTTLTAARTNRRNRHGVKDSCDMYRTINGAEYGCWSIYPTPECIAAYRKAGVRVARRGEHLFVHHMDEAEAKAVDRASEAGRAALQDAENGK